jgi:hypothetical protein
LIARKWGGVGKGKGWIATQIYRNIHATPSANFGGGGGEGNLREGPPSDWNGIGKIQTSIRKINVPIKIVTGSGY